MRLLSSIRRAPAHPELAQRAGFVAAAEESEVGVDLGRASHAGPTSGVVDVPVATSEVESYWYAALRHGALLSSSTAGPATPGACGTRPGDLCPDGGPWRGRSRRPETPRFRLARPAGLGLGSGFDPETCIADKGYDVGPMYEACEASGIRPIIRFG